ncbi:MAG: FAD:protein FMN transferase [Clostridia bacterium]|nr:FAD:protein FMN transferase [Clostridia bacterium]
MNVKRVFIILSVIILLANVFALTSCSRSYTAEGFALGTFYTVKSSKRLDPKAIQDILDSVENKFSVSVTTSDIFRINNSVTGEWIEVSEDTGFLLNAAFDFALTDNAVNAFNPAVFPLVALWGFAPPYLELMEKTPPREEDITAVLAYCDISNFIIEGNSVKRLNENAALDLGGIAKGYAADKIADYLIESGAKRALINLGGTLISIGKNSVIGIAPPRDSNYSYIASFTLSEGFACATSGDYERYYINDGVRYHHIIGKDGYPADSDIISATIICDSGKNADAMSTMVFVEGSAKGIELIRANAAKGILVTRDNIIIAVDIEVKIKDSGYTLTIAE